MHSQWNVSWHHTALGIDSIWAAGTKGAGVTVAILDTGLAAPIGLDRSGFEYLDARGNPIDASDVDGHGTCCGSLIASYRGGALGIAPFAKLVSLRVLETGTSLADVEAALEYVSKRPDVDVVSCSFVMSRCTEAVKDAVATLTTAGKVVVAAAGDVDSESPFPEEVPGLLTAAAVDKERHPLVGARVGLWIDVAAPGAALPVVLRGNAGIGLFGQSSAAAAIVSGIAALVLSKYSDPAIRQRIGRRMESLMKSTAKPLPAEDPAGIGHGMVSPSGLMDSAALLALA